MEEDKNQETGIKDSQLPAVNKKTETSLVVADSCKNCGNPLNLDQRFCGQCGAKRIYNRLTARNLIEDFSERFLNIENAFFKTFMALWMKPEDVINGYVNGLRKRYMSAFSYFAVALTIGSIYMFIFRHWFMDDLLVLDNSFKDGFDATSSTLQNQAQLAERITEGAKDIVNQVLDYNSFFSFIFVPFYALISKIVFWNYKQFNFIEHLVIYLYAYSQTQIVSSVLMILLGWSTAGQLFVSVLVSALPFFYTAYVLYRVFNLDIQRLILKTLLFLVIIFPLTLLLVSLLGGGMYALGVFDPFIETIKDQVEAQKAARAFKDSIATQDSIRMSVEKVKDTITTLKVLKDSLP